MSRTDSPAIASAQRLAALAVLASIGWLGVGICWSDAPILWPLAAYAVVASLALLGFGWPRLAPRWRPTSAAVAWGLGSGVALAAATQLLYPVVAHALPAVPVAVGGLYGRLRAGAAPLELALVLVVVIGEEMIWRGALLEALPGGTGRDGPAWRRWVGVAAASTVYAGAQAGLGSALLCLLAFGCGVVWSALRLRTGSLVAPLVSHAVWDLWVLIAFPLELAT